MKKKAPDSDVKRGGKSESGVNFFVRDLLDDFFFNLQTAE